MLKQLVSIIINNYNYERFLRKAIDSALSQTYSPIEIIVVDDGSTDSSRDIITGYSDDIISLFQPNGKQGAAFNNGFAHSTGGIIIFLDADDYLHPHAVERIVEAWKPNAAKAHYRLEVVDEHGKARGFSLPQGGGTLDSGNLQESILEDGAYCSVPTSGNALSRHAMEQVFPIPAEFNTTSDDYLSVLIPLYGQVIAIDEPLGSYRIHSSNQWALVELDGSRFRRFIAHDLQRCALLKAYAPKLGYDVPNDLEIRAFGSVWSRLTSLRLDPEQHPIPTDSAASLMKQGIKSLWLYSNESVKKRILFSAWFIWVALMPKALAEVAINWLFMPEHRPQPIMATRRFVQALFSSKAQDNRSPQAVAQTQPLRVLFASHAYVVGVNQGKLAAIAHHAKVGLLAPATWQSKSWSRTLTIETPYPDIETFPSKIPFGNLTSGRGGAYIYNPFRVWQITRQFKPDIIQAEVEVFSLCALELAIASRLTNVPLVIFAWENMERQLPFRKWIRDFVLKTAPLIIAGNSDGAQILKDWGYRGEIEVMPQIGVDEQLFTPELAQQTEAEFNIGFLGRLVPEKGVDTLLEAAAALKQQGTEFRLTICGSGPTEQTLKTQAEHLGISENIRWIKAVPHSEVPRQIGKFDALVLPSRTVSSWKEQFGHVLIEAMAVGIPTVGSTCGEIPNVIGYADLIFEEENAAGLARILSRLADDPSFRKSMGQHCLNRAHQLYTHERIAQRSVALWRKVIGHSSPKMQRLPTPASNAQTSR